MRVMNQRRHLRRLGAVCTASPMLLATMLLMIYCCCVSASRVPLSSKDDNVSTSTITVPSTSASPAATGSTSATSAAAASAAQTTNATSTIPTALTTGASNTSNLTTTTISPTTTSQHPIHSTTAPNGTHTPKPVFPTDFNATTSIAFVPMALPGAALTFFGFKFIKATVFLAGGAICGVLFYIFSPAAFNDTPFCCGEKASTEGTVIVTVCVGLVGGLLCLWLFKVGLFLVGMCLGLLAGVISLTVTTPLRDQPGFDTTAAIFGFYAGCALLFGILTVLLQRFFVILTTAFGGAYLVFLGIDYFVRSHLSAVSLYFLERMLGAIRDDLRHKTEHVHLDDHVSNDALLMLAGWLVLSLTGFGVQYYFALRRSNKDDDKTYDSIPLRRRRPSVQTDAEERERLLRSSNASGW